MGRSMQMLFSMVDTWSRIPRDEIIQLHLTNKCLGEWETLDIHSKRRAITPICVICNERQ